jgi:mRNA interferase RelE/StbE
LSYSVEFSEDAVKQIKKLDEYTRRMMYNWLHKHLEGSDDPYSSGHALKGSLKGLWRYRIGDYRLIAKIEKERLVILVLEIGRRSSIYDR